MFGSVSNTSNAAPATLRVDYYHTGDATHESFTINRIVVEPLPWPGNIPLQMFREPRCRTIVRWAGYPRQPTPRHFGSITGLLHRTRRPSNTSLCVTALTIRLTC